MPLPLPTWLEPGLVPRPTMPRKYTKRVPIAKPQPIVDPAYKNALMPSPRKDLAQKALSDSSEDIPDPQVISAIRLISDSETVHGLKGWGGKRTRSSVIAARLKLRKVGYECLKQSTFLTGYCEDFHTLHFVSTILHIAHLQMWLPSTPSGICNWFWKREAACILRWCTISLKNLSRGPNLECSPVAVAAFQACLQILLREPCQERKIRNQECIASAYWWTNFVQNRDVNCTGQWHEDSLTDA